MNMENKSPCFIMVMSLISIPSAACLILAFHFLMGLSGVLLYIIIGVLSFGPLIILILNIINLIQDTLNLFIIARFIAYAYACLLVLFSICFMIGLTIYHFFINYEKSLVLIFFGVQVPCFFLTGSLGNIALSRND